jgi:galactose oxidase-like protein/Kelch motif protein
MTTHVPNRCVYSGLVSVPSANKSYLFNTGYYPSYSSYLNQLYVWNGTNGAGDWTLNNTAPISAAAPLPGRTDHTMAYDGTNVMLYGGRGASSTAGVLQDTWLLNPTTLVWTQSAPTTVPYGRYKAKSAYLAGTGVVMFSGEIVGVMVEETWVWSGTNWTQISVPNGTGPSGRIGHCMAASASQVILFGGQTNQYQLNDTWSYTTAGGWVQLAPTASPSIRSGASLSYDSVNSLFVLNGGMNAYNYLPETWTYSVSLNTWKQISFANVDGVKPSGRIGSQQCFDTLSGTTLLYGGITAGDNYPNNATWEFNGATNLWIKQ